MACELGLVPSDMNREANLYQHPRGDADNSDFIGTPQHDFRRNPTCMVKNILLTRGTLHGVNMSVLNHAAQQWATWFKSTESGQFPANTDIVESLVPLNDLEVEEHLSGGRGGVGVLLGGRCSGFHFPCGKAASLCGFLTGFVQGGTLDGQQRKVRLVVTFSRRAPQAAKANIKQYLFRNYPDQLR